MSEIGKIKITMVAPADNPHTRRFAEFFLREGHELKIVSYSMGEIENVEVYVHSRVPPQVTGVKKKFLHLKDYIQIRKILAWADIVFVNYIYNWRFNEVYRGLNNVIASVWGSDITYREKETETETEVYYKKMILSIARRVLALSKFLANEVREYLPDGVEAIVIPWGVNTDLFHPLKIHKSLDEPVIIGYAKGLYEKYGPHILLEILQVLKNENLNFICRIAGGGELEVQLKIYADRLGIKDKVEFLGRLDPDDMPDFMRGIDIFVMPSLIRESFGVAALEASASGVPVVASDIGGIPEVVWDDETGFLVAPGDVLGFADAISTLITSSDLRGCMGAQGRDFVRKNYSWAQTEKQLMDVFIDVLKEIGKLSV